MNEVESIIQMFTGEQMSSSGTEIIDYVAENISTMMPELTVNVQQLGSGTNIGEILSRRVPFLDKYTDGELLILGIVIFFRILCVIWVLRDASARCESVACQLFSALLIVFLTPVIGLPLYLAFRPLVYKWEKRLWREALEQDIVICPHCQNLNDKIHAMCVWCGEPLQVECKQCHCKYQGCFAYCPECGAPNLE